MFNNQKAKEGCFPFIHVPNFKAYNKQLMHSKSGLTIILIAMLLADSLHALNWQGTGSGMNNTVITEIWKDLSSRVADAAAGESQMFDALGKDISDRLNAQWNPAWNVVFVACRDQYDAILYGYAFRDQWMWYNGVPNTFTAQFSMISSLIVWKDYNCQDWGYVYDYSTSTLTASQRATIKTEAQKLTQDQLTTDIWGSAFSMMKGILANAEFSSGGFSVIMVQDDYSQIYGYVCRKGNNHYSYYDQNFASIVSGKGKFYLFQTR